MVWMGWHEQYPRNSNERKNHTENHHEAERPGTLIRITQDDEREHACKRPRRRRYG
jgi:hypothetical protein